MRYYITDRRQLGGIEALMSTIESALSAGVEMIQIREKDLPTRELMALVSRVLSLADLAGTKIFINDRVDVAVACAAHGVHLPGNS
ncbi:MAG: thiamine phosphate synthase, partial [Bryobacteraceae bacterium]